MICIIFPVCISIVAQSLRHRQKNSVNDLLAHFVARSRCARTERGNEIKSFSKTKKFMHKRLLVYSS